MVKPILYHDISEKNKIEAELVSKIPSAERSAISHVLMSIFANARLLKTGEDKRNTGHSSIKENDQ
ncbi:hypothetical protein KK083_04935 [Fulvivirgaceae bacterium PWU4]|uniref:Uncharacterized protein n=1 Tax=Chryseosolibacter histidini TaxID=2782349 RepID=A0AAP2DJM1_9BACT|nr:hypothetical protein [Chryseosolibacter histidini]MBT1696207.1 hypothetical protein [Chryseosolibacter histidini]